MLALSPPLPLPLPKEGTLRESSTVARNGGGGGGGDGGGGAAGESDISVRCVVGGVQTGKANVQCRWCE